MSEIEFLTLHGRLTQTIVYVGAADGHHIPFLAELFPNHNFILYDPAPFHETVRQFAREHPTRMQIYNQLFTDEDAAGIARLGRVLFISDIRNLPEKFKRVIRKEAVPEDIQEEAEENILEDMRRQETWVFEIQPAAAMLKFRLPWDPDVAGFEYLAGDIHLQVWAGNSSSETRLISTPPYAKKIYDTRLYDDAMHYFNIHTRSTSMELLVQTVGLEAAAAAGMPLSYDVCSEQLIIKRYLMDARGVDETQCSRGIRQILREINGTLGRTLSEKYQEKLEQFFTGK